MARTDSRGVSLRGFRLSRQACDRYQFPSSLLSAQGNVALHNFHAARVFAQRMNTQRDLVRHPERAAKAGHINAMSLIDEINRQVSAEYRRQMNPEMLAQALRWLEERLGSEVLEETLVSLADVFPPRSVYQGTQTPTEFVAGESDETVHRQLLLEELLMVWLDNMNPAYQPYLELFDDSPLVEDTAYQTLIALFSEFCDAQPAYGPRQQSLVALLRSPALSVPNSLSGQLEYILTHWGPFLGDYLFRLLSSLDLIKEEEKAIFFGPGPALVPEYRGLATELERFSQDLDWMPRLVLIAKNTYVWLDQLTKKYGRPITHIDEIPDAELDELARWGFTGLWLIGSWERSSASRLIKQYCGNDDAVASAYSLKGYDTAETLGGDAALHSLRTRAWQRGIRLASDMVPNHMGIDSHWVIEHPDWFVSLDESPFPSYTFNGGNLSSDPRVGIFVEDHYYSRNDAAVVFKRVDMQTGSTKYIYHGNDGTNMPWNDTAQLNYLIPEVREAVIQTILHVARQFPVIRFDAAMTLAKKHYQRLWFPEPGSGGAIPSRAEHGMTRADFDTVFPEEFWREVVDRVAREAPDTLLLAEAFWLMEGYFVRTLGMHRVYNSAFMNMLRDEDNAKYRSVMKNTMEFDPEIMKRLVNFMNNPDERTAVDQFGKDDKYFGVCVMMCTLPGLPMFGHGQIEGFAEKYGMEFQRAYWNEQPEEYLVARHEREIFPLLHRRSIFAEVEHFHLYDFYTEDGHVNEDVFAYSNRRNEHRGLIVYQNKFATTSGWIRTSAAMLEKKSESERQLRQHNLGEGLALHAEDDYFVIFRDQHTGLEYLRPSQEFFTEGLFLELHAYQYYIFLDFREMQENAWGHCRQITTRLQGAGVPSIDALLRELRLAPLHEPFKALVNGAVFTQLFAARGNTKAQEVYLELLAERLPALLKMVKEFSGGVGDETLLLAELQAQLQVLQALPAISVALAALTAQENLSTDLSAWGVLYGWLFTHALGKIVDAGEYADQSCSWLDEWMLGKLLREALVEFGLTDEAARHAVSLIRVLIMEQEWFQSLPEEDHPVYEVLAHWLQDTEIQRFLCVNRYEDVVWYNREAYTELITMLEVTTAVLLASSTDEAPALLAARREQCRKVLQALRAVEVNSEYRVERLLANARNLSNL